MKKIICLLTAILLVLISCSTDNTPNENPTFNSLLVKKIIKESTIYGASTYNYFYEGNKLLHIENQDEYFHGFTYQDNLIILEEWSIKVGGRYSNEYVYNSENKLIELKMHSEVSTGLGGTVSRHLNKVLYTYNTNGTISYVIYSVEKQNEITLASGKFYLTNGQITKHICSNPPNTVGNSSTITQTINYIYDSKNSPMQNILGWKEKNIANFHDFFNCAGKGLVNNITSVTLTNGNSINYESVVYTCNEFSGYPLNSQETYGGIVFEHQYFYE